MDDLDILWQKNAVATKRLQEIADQMAERAESRASGISTDSSLDRIIAGNYHEALRRVWELGDQLEEAAIKAGILPKRS